MRKNQIEERPVIKSEIDNSWMRRGRDTKRRYCDECDKIISKGKEFVETPDHKFLHFICAGMASEIKTCGECFMIAANCDCA